MGLRLQEYAEMGNVAYIVLGFILVIFNEVFNWYFFLSYVNEKSLLNVYFSSYVAFSLGSKVLQACNFHIWIIHLLPGPEDYVAVGLCWAFCGTHLNMKTNVKLIWRRIYASCFLRVCRSHPNVPNNFLIYFRKVTCPPKVRRRLLKITVVRIMRL